MKRDNDFARSMLRMCGDYMQRARVGTQDERDKAIVMAVGCLAWAIYREPARAMPLFKEAA